MAIVWTDELLEFIRKRASENASASTVACELGAKGYAVTRNSVIGKAHRNEIIFQSTTNGRPAEPRAPRSHKRKAAIAGRVVNIVPREVKRPTIPFLIPLSTKPVSIGELNKSNCHWPLGDSADRPPFMYCGDPVLEGCSYCPRHTAVSTLATKGTSRAATNKLLAGYYPGPPAPALGQ